LRLRAGDESDHDESVPKANHGVTVSTPFISM